MLLWLRCAPSLSCKSNVASFYRTAEKVLAIQLVASVSIFWKYRKKKGVDVNSGFLH